MQSVKLVAYSCWTVAASHRTSRAFHQYCLLPCPRSKPISTATLSRSEFKMGSRFASNPGRQNIHAGARSGIPSRPRHEGFLIRKLQESSSQLPSSSIRTGVNSVGLLTCGSSNRSCLPSAAAPVACLLRSSPLTVAGPCRIFTGFPCTQNPRRYTAVYKISQLRHRRSSAAT